jgi:hypothetical protein
MKSACSKFRPQAGAAKDRTVSDSANGHRDALAITPFLTPDASFGLPVHQEQ